MARDRRPSRDPKRVRREARRVAAAHPRRARMRLGGQLHAPDQVPHWATPVAWVLIAVSTATLAWVAFAHHPIGDYLTESDFYGGYATGAHMLLRGVVEPGRYGVYGPVYEVVLAVFEAVFRNAFVSGRLLSIAAWAGTLIAWFVLVSRRTNAYVGLWLVALLAVQPVLFRYGYSATTDVLTVFLQAVTVFALLAMRGTRAPLWAGLLAGVAVLARYNLAYLVPAGVLCMVLPTERTGRRLRRIALFLAGFTVVVVPWFAFSASQGHIPGSVLFTNYGFYSTTDSGRHIQDMIGEAREAAAPTTLLELLRREGPALLARWGRDVGVHAWRDLAELLGWPVAVLVILGIGFAVRDGTWRRLLPIWITGAFAFAALIPVFYSDRYSLSPLPFYLTLAATAAASPLLALWVKPPGFPLKGLLALVPLGLALQSNVQLQLFVESQVPVEVHAAARVLAEAAPEGGRVISRKAHVAYYSGLEAVAFPRVTTLAELADYARETRAGFLYFSWIEAELRPEFWYLLDTTGVVPGLEVLLETKGHPSVTYRIGPDFGREPEWMADEHLKQVHVARALIKVRPNSERWEPYILLGLHAIQEKGFAEASRLAQLAIRIRPDDPQGWLLLGEAELLRHNWARATRAYERVLTIDPTNAPARLGVGRVLVATRRFEDAARVWRPVIDEARSPLVLRQMAAVFESLGDREALDRVRARQRTVMR